MGDWCRQDTENSGKVPKQIWKLLRPPLAVKEFRPSCHISNDISSHPPPAGWAPPRWPPCCSHITSSSLGTRCSVHVLDAYSFRRLEGSSPALFRDGSYPAPHPHSSVCSTVISSERPFLTALPPYRVPHPLPSLPL